MKIVTSIKKKKSVIVPTHVHLLSFNNIILLNNETIVGMYITNLQITFFSI